MGRESVGAAGDRGSCTVDDVAPAVVGPRVESRAIATFVRRGVKHPGVETTSERARGGVTFARRRVDPPAGPPAARYVADSRRDILDAKPAKGGP